MHEISNVRGKHAPAGGTTVTLTTYIFALVVQDILLSASHRILKKSVTFVTMWNCELRSRLLVSHQAADRSLKLGRAFTL